jgi:DNA-binding CsgD family transcriptional regulator
MEVEDRRLAIDLVGDRRHLALLLSEQFVEIPAKMLEALGLTPRETEVLKWVAEGKRDGEIAIILGLSSRTVSHHLERIYRKLSVETRTAAAARAREVVSLAATQ